MFRYLLLLAIIQETLATESTAELQYLNELPLDKLLTLKSSLTELVSVVDHDNGTIEAPPHVEAFGAQAMAIKAPPVKRTDYEEGLYKKDGHGKIGNIFSMSVTTLAFLAFGGYLLCLIVQAVKAKHSAAAAPQPTFFVNAGIKRPQTNFGSYGRRRRALRGFSEDDLTPERLFTALLHFCEGYAKWSKHSEDAHG